MEKSSSSSKPPASTTSEPKPPIPTSYLLPDPPMFRGKDDEYEYEDWALRMRDKLNGNADRFNEQAATAYVISRIGGEAAKHILCYRLQDPDYFKNPSMIFDALHDIYASIEHREFIQLAYGRDR